MFVYTMIRARQVSDTEAISRACRSHSVGCYVVEKFGGRLIQCWHEVSSHNSRDAADKAAKRLSKKLNIPVVEVLTSHSTPCSNGSSTLNNEGTTP